MKVGQWVIWSSTYDVNIGVVAKVTSKMLRVHREGFMSREVSVAIADATSVAGEVAAKALAEKITSVKSEANRRRAEATRYERREIDRLMGRERT